MGKYRGHWFEPHDYQTFEPINQKPKMRGTRGAHGLGHVSSYYSPTPGHVSTFNSSTIDQPTASTSSPYGPVTCCVSMPRQSTRRMLTSSYATCHPSSGDTCHFQIGQTVCQKVQNRMTHGITWSHHVSCTDLPHVLYGPAMCPVRACHVSLYGHAMSASVRTVRTAQSANFCLFEFLDRMRYLLHTNSV